MINRIQRLFMSEYKSLDDLILVESPFAETTKNGIGIRQVHIGLTPTKLIIAADLLPEANVDNAIVHKSTDPRIETLELVTVCGIECVTLSIYHRRKRQTLKAHFCNSVTAYYELGGFVMRASYWNLWCERVRYLNPESEIVRSCSETSAASSSTCSTQYVLGKTCGAGEGGVQMHYCGQIFCTHGEPKRPSLLGRGKGHRRKWTERDVYLGAIEEIKPENYRPAQPSYIEKGKSEPELTFIYRKPPKNKKKKPQDKSSSDSQKDECTCFPIDTKDSSISRFAEGVSDQCISSLRLRVDPPPPVERHSLLQTPRNPNTLRHLTPLAPPCPPDLEPAEIADLAVELWEAAARVNRCRSRLMKHKRRYALIPKPHLLNGLGPWTLANGEQYSLQVKRAVSCVRVRGAANVDPNLLPLLPRRLLTASISDENLSRLKGTCGGVSVRFAVQSEPALLFWTTNLWYRPRRGFEAYREQREFLRTLPQKLLQRWPKKVKTSSGIYNYFKSRPKKYKKSRKWSAPAKNIDHDSEIFDKDEKLTIKKVSSKLSAGCDSPSTSVIDDQPLKSSRKKKAHDPCAAVRRALRVRKPFNAWNFDSTMLAYQLTMTDRKLFLQITPREFANVIWTQSSRNSPNLTALIAFAHRVTCLVTTSIVSEEDLRRRARLIARFIYTAEKCNQIHNFQSCYSVLAGLQSPPCYRLRRTWAHVRKKHAQMHDIFENLCKLYRDPRLPGYQRAYHLGSRAAPYLPFLGHIICRLLDRLPDVDQHFLNRPSSARIQPKHVLEKNCSRLCDDSRDKEGSSKHNVDGIEDNVNSPAVRKRLFSAFGIGK